MIVRSLDNRSERTKWRKKLSEVTNELEVTLKLNEEMTTEKENLSQLNHELIEKVKVLKQENKKSLKMVCSVFVRGGDCFMLTANCILCQKQVLN